MNGAKGSATDTHKRFADTLRPMGENIYAQHLQYFILFGEN